MPKIITKVVTYKCDLCYKEVDRVVNYLKINTARIVYDSFVGILLKVDTHGINRSDTVVCEQCINDALKDGKIELIYNDDCEREYIM